MALGGVKERTARVTSFGDRADGGLHIKAVREANIQSCYWQSGYPGKAGPDVREATAWSPVPPDMVGKTCV